MTATNTGEFQTGTPATTTPPGGGAHFTGALLQATLSAHKISSMVALLWDGPQLWAFSVSLGLGEDPARVERLGSALALVAGADSARVARNGGRLLVEIPKPPGERRELRAGRLDRLEPPAITAVALGITTGGRVAWLDLADERTCHVIIGGTTGSGKTKLLQWLLYRLLRQNEPEALRLLALDPKRGELASFAHVPHLLHPIASGGLDITRLLSWTTDELDRRLSTGRTMPRLVIVAEEVADLLTACPNAGGAVARIAQVGRGLGVHLIATTQQPGARALGDALANLPARILGRVASATLTYGAAGRSRTMADQLLGRGDFLLLTADGALRLQAPLIDGRQLAQLPRTDQVATLDDELPSLAVFADLAGRDHRGGQGRRELTADDYATMAHALQDGASPDALREQFGIGWDRAARIVGNYRGNEP